MQYARSRRVGSRRSGPSRRTTSTFAGFAVLVTAVVAGLAGAPAGWACLDCGDEGVPPPPTQQFLLQTDTPLTLPDAPNFDFVAGDYNGDRRADLIAIKRANTGSGRVEVHVLDAARRYSAFGLQWPTPLTLADAQNFDFAAGDYNGDGRADILAIKRENTGTGRVEVHVLDAARNYAAFSLQWDTPIPLADASHFDFTAGDYDGDGRADLLAVKRDNASTGRVEVHVLDAARMYTAFSRQWDTPITLADAPNFAFSGGDSNRDGRADVLAIKRRESGTGSIEVHAVDGAGGYTGFNIQTGTPFETADADNFEFTAGDYNGDGRVDLVGVKRTSTGTGLVEAHVLDYRVAAQSAEGDDDSLTARVPEYGGRPLRAKGTPTPSGGDRNRVVLFVHGLDWVGESAADCREWGPMRSNLRSFGWRPESLVTLAYYYGDHDCSHSISHHGSHATHTFTDHPGSGGDDGHRIGSAGATDQGHKSHSHDTDIRHLGYHFAWYVWRHFSGPDAEHGQQAVNVVAHSMGGLIVRYALAQAGSHPDFPPFLIVRNAVAIGTPHRGALLASISDEFLPELVPWQGSQMRTDSGFVQWLARNAQNPQGSQSGTDWTLISSYDDDVVFEESGVGMRAAHKVVYARPPYGHTELRGHDEGHQAWGPDDADVIWRDGPVGWYRWPNSAPRPITWTYRALITGRW